VAIQAGQELGLVGKNILGSASILTSGSAAEAEPLSAASLLPLSLPSPETWESQGQAYPSCGKRPVGQAHQPQQRGDLGQRACHRRQRGGLVQEDRYRGEQGTKIFSLVGKVNNTGLVEVPMGISLREIIYDMGGGIPGGKKFKAVQTGGPSGGCIPSR